MFLFVAAIEMDNIDDASEISDVSHVNRVCRLLEVSISCLISSFESSASLTKFKLFFTMIEIRVIATYQRFLTLALTKAFL